MSKAKPKKTAREQVTLDDLLLLDAVGEKAFDRIMRTRRRKAKRHSINKDDVSVS